MTSEEIDKLSISKNKDGSEIRFMDITDHNDIIKLKGINFSKIETNLRQEEVIKPILKKNIRNKFK